MLKALADAWPNWARPAPGSTLPEAGEGLKSEDCTFMGREA
jgi:hypothetical protein